MITHTENCSFFLLYTLWKLVGSLEVDLSPCVDLTILVYQITGGGLVIVAASSSVLVCTVDVLAVVAVVAQLELMDLKMEPSFSVQNPPI